MYFVILSSICFWRTLIKTIEIWPWFRNKALKNSYWQEWKLDLAQTRNAYYKKRRQICFSLKVLQQRRADLCLFHFQDFDSFAWLINTIWNKSVILSWFDLFSNPVLWFQHYYLNFNQCLFIAQVQTSKVHWFDNLSTPWI